VLVLLAAGCGGSANQPASPPSSSPVPVVTYSASAEPTATATASDVIAWDDASQHEGESVTVEGPVAGTDYAESSNGSPTFLNVGVDYPDSSRFVVLIWGEDRSAFPDPPEDYYSGKPLHLRSKRVAAHTGFGRAH
jgi:hypothetical protein